MPHPVYIYGLICPDSHRIRYVGKTRSSVRKRLSEHMRVARDVLDARERAKRRLPHRKKFPKVAVWLADLLERDTLPSLVILDERDEDFDDCRIEELQWMCVIQATDASLLNQHWRFPVLNDPMEESTKN
jgi:hypothetical protein